MRRGSGARERQQLPDRPAETVRPNRHNGAFPVVDGTVRSTGSQNVIDRSYNKNRTKGLQWIGLVPPFARRRRSPRRL